MSNKSNYDNIVSELYHASQVRLIKHNPGLINLEGVLLSSQESLIFNEKGRVVNEPDNLMFDPSTHTLYNIEYKTSDNQNTRYKARRQLKSSRKHLSNIFKNWEIVNLYVSKDFKVKKI